MKDGLGRFLGEWALVGILAFLALHFFTAMIHH